MRRSDLKPTAPTRTDRRPRPARGLRCGALVLTSIVGLGMPAEAADWPGYRGPGHDNRVAAAGAFAERDVGLRVAWRSVLGSGYSGVAVVGGRAVTLFAAGEHDIVAAFDIASGEELWRYRLGPTYTGHDGSHDGPISTPAVAGGRVYALGAWGALAALDLETGAEVWRTDLVDDHGAEKPWYGFSSSPLVAGGRLIVEFTVQEKGSIAGFDADTGERLWIAGDDAVSYQSPVPLSLAGVDQVMAVGEAFLYGIDPQSGDLLWSYEHGGDGAAIGSGSMNPGGRRPGPLAAPAQARRVEDDRDRCRRGQRWGGGPRAVERSDDPWLVHRAGVPRRTPLRLQQPLPDLRRRGDRRGGLEVARAGRRLPHPGRRTSSGHDQEGRAGRRRGDPGGLPGEEPDRPLRGSLVDDGQLRRRQSVRPQLRRARPRRPGR